MPDPRRRSPSDGAPGARHTTHRLRPQSRRSVIGLTLLVVMVVAVGWVGTRAWLATAQLEQAQALVSRLKTDAAEATTPGSPPRSPRSSTTRPAPGASPRTPCGARRARARARPQPAGPARAHGRGRRCHDRCRAAGRTGGPAHTRGAGAQGRCHPARAVQDGRDRGARGRQAVRSDQSRLAGLDRGTLRQVSAAKTTLVTVVDAAASALSKAAPMVQQLPTMLVPTARAPTS